VSAPIAIDETLIQAVARGDRSAMQILFARHRVKVFRFVLRLVRHQATAEDLTADVFLDVWRNASRFEGRSAAATWILAIARFKALSALRRSRERTLEETTLSASSTIPRAPRRCWRTNTGATSCARAWHDCRSITARSSISCTTTRNRSTR
jgi:RNA polymerase sigma factor (sigma-70 family)